MSVKIASECNDQRWEVNDRIELGNLVRKAETGIVMKMKDHVGYIRFAS